MSYRGRIEAPRWIAALACAIAFAATSGVASAQSEPTPAPSTPPTIGSVSVATQTKRALTTLPVPADLLGRAEIRATPGRTVESSLAAVPGYSQTGTDARFSHPHDGAVGLGGVGGGVGTAQALVLLDSVPITNFNGGWVDWSRVPKLLVDRIEAVRTGASALYGTQAIGGVIAIETRVPRGSEVATDVYGGTLGSFGAALAASERTGARSAVSLYVDDQKSDGFRAAVVPNPSQPTSRYRGQRAFVRAYSGDDDHRLEAGTAVFVDHREGDPSGPSFFVGRSTFARYRASAAHRQELAASASVDQTDYAFVLVNGAGATVSQSRLGWSTLGAAVQDTFGAPQLRLTVGADGRLANGHRDTLSPSLAPLHRYEGLQRGLGTFAQADVIARRTEVLATLRYDAYFQGPATALDGTRQPAVVTPYRDDTAHHVSPRLAVRYTLSPALNLRASYSNAFSAPNWNSLYGGFFIGGGIFFAGNPALKPETADRDEIGFDLAPSAGSRFTFDVYRAQIQNRVVFAPVAKRLFQRVNLGSATAAGYEASYQAQLAPDWSLRASAAIARGTILAAPFRSGVGKVLPQDPFQTAFVQFRYERGRTTFTAGGRYSGMQYGDDANSLVYGNALTFDTSLAIRLSRDLELYGEAQNVNNRRYLTDPTAYGPPSTVIVGVRTARR